MQTVKDNWVTYQKACYGDRVISPIQEKEVRQAFYSGAFCMLGLLGILTPLPEDEAVRKLETIHKEVEGEITNQILRRMKRDN